MPVIVNVHEAKTHLSRLLERVEAGEEIIIARAGEPCARLVGLQSAPKERAFGVLRGRLSVPDDFLAPLPEEELDAWES